MKLKEHLCLLVLRTVKHLADLTCHPDERASERTSTIVDPNTLRPSNITRSVVDSSSIDYHPTYSKFILQSKISVHKGICYLFTGDPLKLWQEISACSLSKNTADEVFLFWISLISFSSDTTEKNFFLSYWAISSFNQTRSSTFTLEHFL